MRVAVIVPNLNNGCFLGRCLQSIVEQTAPATEIIVADGCSTDNSHAVFASFRERMTWLTIPPRGLPQARNEAIRSTSCEFVVPLDSDDWIEPTYLEQCLKFFREDQEGDLGVVAPSLVWPNGRVQHSVPPFTAESFLTGNRLFVCSMFRRRCWEEAGGYDENPNIHEDWLLWAKIAASGWRIEPLFEPLFHYCPHNGGLMAKLSESERTAQRKRTEDAVRAYLSCHA